MSLFSSIVDKIFHHGASPAAAPATATATAPATSTAAAGTSATASATATAEPVDVEAVLNGLAAKRSEKLNWRTSIVDLMKLLDLDSSITSRKQLAAELGYGADTGDSAAMNIWLHKQVMHKLAENGGKVPDDLKA